MLTSGNGNRGERVLTPAGINALVYTITQIVVDEVASDDLRSLVSELRNNASQVAQSYEIGVGLSPREHSNVVDVLGILAQSLQEEAARRR